MKTSAKVLTFLAVLGSSPLLHAADNDALVRMLADRAMIQEVAYRYINALDTRDAEMYLSVFTEDAEYDVEGTVYRGHEELRGIITGLQASRDAAAAEGRPTVDLYHTNINPVIDFVSADEAHYQAYWQTLRKADDNSMRIGGMGMIKDVLVRVGDGWRIKKRVLTNFVPRLPAPTR
jgi:3-phenylpropionate/cinnamic acid dioxygenase small subunit